MADYSVLAKSQDINFVAKFESDLHNLLNLLGKTEVQVMTPGTAIKIYKASGSASEETVAEKDLIPDSGISMGKFDLDELAYKKYRNLVGIETIGKMGYEVAVGGANTKLLRDVQKGIRGSIYNAIKMGTGTATEKTFQQKVAKAAAFLEKKFEDEAFTPVIFANPDDAYEYLGDHVVTLENQFGLSYLQNFMGIGNVVIDSNVEAGTVIGTATENLALMAASVNEIPEMEMTSDETGIIAVKNEAVYENGALQTVAYCGLGVYPIYKDRIVKVTEA